jgi:hypothetical protein
LQALGWCCQCECADERVVARGRLSIQQYLALFQYVRRYVYTHIVEMHAQRTIFNSTIDFFAQTDHPSKLTPCVKIRQRDGTQCALLRKVRNDCPKPQSSCPIHTTQMDLQVAGCTGRMIERMQRSPTWSVRVRSFKIIFINTIEVLGSRLQNF